MSVSESSVPPAVDGNVPIPSIPEQIAAELATWPLNERLCDQCASSITDEQLKKIVCTEIDPANALYTVTHGPGDCNQGFLPLAPNSWPSTIPPAAETPTTNKQGAVAKAKATAEAESAMAVAMDAMAEAKALAKAEKAEKAKWGPMPMTEAETMMATAKSMKKQALKMKADAEKL
jgi:hypothetical protein